MYKQTFVYILGIHDILKIVIDRLRETTKVIDEDILKDFREFTEHKERLLVRGVRR